MNINWFPGHMTKSLRMMDESVGLVDVLLYVLDARAPASCINPEFNRYTQRLPVIYIINKSDLGKDEDNLRWKSKLTTDSSRAILLNATTAGSTKKIIPIIEDLCREKLERYQKKGVRTMLRAMVIGVPNSGKSTIVNNLCGKGKAITGNKAGVTRGKQWVRVSPFLEIMDTPGTLYPKLDNQTAARRLAYIGSIRDEIVDTTELAIEFLREITELDKGLIDARYKISSSNNTEMTLKMVALSRGLLLRGGEPDIDRAASAIIDDFRKGRMGKITLDSAL